MPTEPTRLTPKEAEDLLAELEKLEAAGDIDRREEKNPSLLWRFDGAAGIVKLYRNKKKRTLTLLVDPKSLEKDFLERPACLAEAQLGGKKKKPRGSLRPSEKAGFGYFEELEPSGAKERGSGAEEAPSASAALREDDLSPDQMEVYEKLLRWALDPDHESQYLTLGGYAGTGKSTLVALLARRLTETTRVAFCAYTGKAANVLQRKLAEAGVTPAFCGTLHSLLYSAEVDGKTGRLVGFWPKDDLDADLVVVDEASMVGETIWSDLLQTGKKVLAVGDHGQLEPVEGEMISLVKDPVLRLEKIHRQAEGNPIIRFASFVRGGGDPEQFDFSSVSSENVRWARDRDELRELMGDWFASASDPLESAALVYTNATRVLWNGRVREIAGRKSPLAERGDVVICLRNQELASGRIFNGMRGWVEEVEDEGDDADPLAFHATVAFPQDGWRLRGRISRHQFGRKERFRDFVELAAVTKRPIRSWEDVGLFFDFGTALTVHKAQGSQFRRVALYLEHRSMRDPAQRARWLYTAVTRAVDELVLVPR